MTTRLMVYNEALRMCGDRNLATLTEDREPRRLLDDVWNNGGVDFCLEQGFWQFCTRFVRLDYDTAITPAFGFNRAFTKPTDWVKTAGVTSDEFFNVPLIHYKDLSGYWYASIDEIYVEYISNGASYGNDLSIWPQSFADYVASVFARKIVVKLTADEKKQDLIEKKEARYLLTAKNHDASGSPQKFPALGNWASSRQTITGRNRDRGNRGSLIG
jgi:hypothetical protein